VIVTPETYLTRAEAAFVTATSPDAIGKWHARGWLAPDGNGGTVRRHLRTRTGKGGRLEYHYGDLLSAERDTRSSGYSRRSTPPASSSAA
jgi:hypothetical protein